MVLIGDICSELLKLTTMKKIIYAFALLFLSSPMLTIGQPDNWVTLNTGTTKNINDVYFHSPDTGYIVGDNNLFKKTADGGKTWQSLPTPVIGERPGNNGDIVAIEYHEFSPWSHFNPLKKSLILIWERPYYPVVTQDEGAHYEPFSLPGQDSLVCHAFGYSVQQYTNSITQLAMYGKSCDGANVITKYMDGSFITYSEDTTYHANHGHFTTLESDDSLIAIAGHSDGNLLSYSGHNRFSDTVFLDSSGVDAIAYAGNQTWYASTSREFWNVYVSTDNGATFRVDSSLAPTFYYPDFNDMDFLDNGEGLAGGKTSGHYGCIFSKANGQWNYYRTQYQINAVKLFPGDTAYAGGDSGLLLKSGDRLSNIHERTESNNFLTIFPNPANEFINLKTGPDVQVQNIELWDMNGRPLRSFPSGSTTLMVSDLPGSFYLLVVRTHQGQFVKRVFIR